MQLTFNSRAKAKKDIPTLENTLIISFNDTKAEELEVISLFDFESNNTLLPLICADDETSFTDTAAANIVNAVAYAMRNNMDIYVHCWAGISRSAAVAKFINDVYKLNIPTLTKYKVYNNKIYTTLLNCETELNDKE